MTLTDIPAAISVVVPCRDHAEVLTQCLQGLRRQIIAVPYEIVVVDSAADPKVVEAVAAFPGVRLVRSEAGLLPAEARNLGAAHATAAYLAFIDADCVPDPGWLAAARDALEVGAHLAGGPVLDLRPFHPIAASDNLLQFSDFPAGRPEGAPSYFPGCNLAIRRSEFSQVGGFPSTNGYVGEDTLFCTAVLKQWPAATRFVQAMRVRHLGRTSFRPYLRHQAFFGFSRGRLGIRLNRHHKRYGAWVVLIPSVALKRLFYILKRVACWNPTALPRAVLLMPVLLVGLLAWAVGFRHGLRVAAKEGP